MRWPWQKEEVEQVVKAAMDVVRNEITVPAPMIVIEIPKIRSETKVMHRNSSGEVLYVTTEYEYE